MDIRLIPDLIRQWIDIHLLTDAMYRELPEDDRDDWSDLPWNRYQNFYGVLVPVIIHDALFRLHQVPIDPEFRKVASAQALVTGIFDDLFDRLHLPGDRIRALMETPDYIISSEHLEEYLCQYLLREIYKHFSGNQHLLDKSISGIIRAQQSSAQQRTESNRQSPQADLHKNDLIHITKEKGAKAVLFYRSCINRSLTTEEDLFLAELGAMLQMTNDINDALKDHQNGEVTIMTLGLPLQEVRTIFDDQLKLVREARKALSDERYYTEGLFYRIHILVARSLVTLDRYAQIVDASEPFDIRDIPPNKVISGLDIKKIPSWRRYYREMSD